MVVKLQQPDVALVHQMPFCLQNSGLANTVEKVRDSLRTTLVNTSSLIIAFKGGIRDFFYNLLTVREPSPARTLKCVIVCKLSATCVQRGTKGQLSYSVWQSINLIHLSVSFFVFVFCFGLTIKQSTRRKALAMSFRKCHIGPTKARRFKPQVRLEPAQEHWWQARKADMLKLLHHAFLETVQSIYGAFLVLWRFFLFFF